MLIWKMKNAWNCYLLWSRLPFAGLITLERGWMTKNPFELKNINVQPKACFAMDLTWFGMLFSIHKTSKQNYTRPCCYSGRCWWVQNIIFIKYIRYSEILSCTVAMLSEFPAGRCRSGRPRRHRRTWPERRDEHRALSFLIRLFVSLPQLFA